MSQVILERPSAQIAHIRLNRPKARNALTLDIRKSLAAIFNELAVDEELRCAVLSGEGGNFSGGADLSDMVQLGAIEIYQRHTERLWAAVSDCPVPVIAAVEGYALGGGMELAMHADIIVTDPAARMGQPEVRVGIMPGAGGTQRLLRAVGRYRAMLLCLTGDQITGAQAANMGLASKLVDEGAVLDEAHALAEKIARMPPLAVAQIKEVIHAGADAPLSSALALERKAFQILFASEDKTEGMNAFLEKRRPDYSGR
ncbi:enoyl-CoA hydratase [Rhodobacteraceae bacterium WD3A24]|nr:enoyl-CoA hydratase [Rhodobacteraceae bacterium WD3A24]